MQIQTTHTPTEASIQDAMTRARIERSRAFHDSLGALFGIFARKG